MVEEIVHAGSCIVAGKREGALEAHLGTAVGVTLSDSRAGIGGLLHLVFPRPLDSKKALQPELYATTGLPLFIDKLSRKGASKKRLEACTAGGGMLGDLAFDLGARTADAVSKILGREGIPVRKNEVGGFSGCRLRLNLKTLESSVERFRVPASDCSDIVRIPPSPQDINKSLDLLRPIPRIAFKLIDMIVDRACTISEIAHELEQDQILAARILKYCNSPGVGQGRKVESMDRALLVLGSKELLNIALAISVKDFFNETDGGYSLCKEGMFKHSVGTAIAARILAEAAGGVSGSRAYTAGLLHDIGKVILDQYMARWFPLFYQKMQAEHSNLSSLEREIFGLSHEEAGSLLAKRWSLPERLTEVIRHHHSPQKAFFDPELTALIHVADGIAARFMPGLQVESVDSESMAFSFSKLGLSKTRLQAVLADLASKSSGHFLRLTQSRNNAVL